MVMTHWPATYPTTTCSESLDAWEIVHFLQDVLERVDQQGLKQGFVFNEELGCCCARHYKIL